MTPGPHVGPAHILASTFPAEQGLPSLNELIPVGGISEKIWRLTPSGRPKTLFNKTKGGKLLVRVYCETGDTRTAKIESFFSGLFFLRRPYGVVTALARRPEGTNPPLVGVVGSVLANYRPGPIVALCRSRRSSKNVATATAQ